MCYSVFSQKLFGLVPDSLGRLFHMRKKNYRNRGAEPKQYVEPEVVEVEVVEAAPVAEKKTKKSAKAAAAAETTEPEVVQEVVQVEEPVESEASGDSAE